MIKIDKRTISLPAEQAAYIDAKVKAGDYASVSEVVRAGLWAVDADENFRLIFRFEEGHAYEVDYGDYH